MTNTKDDVFAPAKKYVKMLSKLTKQLKNKKPKDRLEYAIEITNCLNAISTSIKGWNAWLTNLETLQTLTMEDFQQFYPKMLESTINFLKMDIEITNKKIDEAIVKYNKGKQKLKPKLFREPYVS